MCKTPFGAKYINIYIIYFSSISSRGCGKVEKYFKPLDFLRFLSGKVCEFQWGLNVDNVGKTFNSIFGKNYVKNLSTGYSLLFCSYPQVIHNMST